MDREGASKSLASRGFSAGRILQDELEARGWNQTDLAEILGRGPTVVHEILLQNADHSQKLRRHSPTR